MSNFFRGDTNILFIKFGGEFLPVACLTQNGIQEGVDSLETTTVQNNGWNTSVPTFQNYTVNFSGLMTDDQDSPFTKISMVNLRSIKRARTIFEWEIRTNNGQYVDFGSGYISELSQVAGVDEFISFSGTIQGVGALNQSAGDVGVVTWDRTDITFDSTIVTWDNT